MNPETFLAIFRQHGETKLAELDDFRTALRTLDGWRELAKKSYPNFDWTKQGVVFKGSAVKGGEAE